MDKAENIDRVTTILSDRTKFECILNDPYRVVLKLEEKLNRVLRPIKEYPGKTTYDF